MRFVMRFEARDAPKRLAVATMVCAIMAYFGMLGPAALCIGLIVATEALVAFQIKQFTRKKGTFDKRSVLIPLFVLVLNSCVYCLPAIFLVQADRTAANFAAFIWLGGFLTHACGVHGLIRVWSWVAIVPPAAATIVCAFLLYDGERAPPGAGDNIVIYLGAFMAVGNTIEVVLRQRDNRRAFAEAQVAAEERLMRLEFLATHDALTGLLNRAAFDEGLADLMLATDHVESRGIIMIDLDGFKGVNDSFGHAAGDAVLVEVAERIRATVGSERGARLGGDEFAVLLTGEAGKAESIALAEALHEALQAPVEFEGEPLAIGASLGVAFRRAHSDSATQICSRADRAMYNAKSSRLRRPVIAEARNRSRPRSLSSG